ncbi:NADP-dependent oxidoreductase [Klebsiella pneumoniae]|uniref:NADP-dependent oxidoreductase n=1 Tax=Klebsiella pneumoniae TaxID=573 RepID=UPI0025A08F0A|nr:NADP-dependent oxidoreductase [Klebsiella pneumoniae]MDM7042331.1 NADP-dependent oxidoreductase [Klebsiella pneumoniae]MDM7103199.1 NADP-dependent oxidoreductase [Klebsiella pneumoniae]MDM7107409.1 NADP-dependent oxidoreductase [Klebsiella pneumoniae]MDM7120113.1 NADP-dependent oxidoreductase [Klebsiella pneumoniae]MDM7124106.1 NADP-dependent oxidoreductase [Klebsiella pneumoniae]
MSTQMMKAVQQHAFGGPEVLSYEDAPMPVLQAGEVLVQVHAVGVNPPDSYLRDGYQQLPPEWRPEVRFPLILGTDLSGVVVARADDVREVAVGDEVYAMARFPEGAAGGSRAYAEYVSVPVSDLARKPLTLSHQQAAAVPMSLLTAWQFMIDPGHEVANPLQPGPHRPVPLAGKRVLVNGAAGGVGHFAVQLAKWQGAEVIAVAAGCHEAFLRQLGADRVIDYTTTAVEETVRDLDLVIDAPGGPASGRFLRTLRPGGALYPIFPLGFAGAEEARQRGVTVSTTQERSSGAQLARLADLLDAGVIRVAIDSVFPLAQAQMAHERAAQGHLEGKIVLSVMDSSAG